MVRGPGSVCAQEDVSRVESHRFFARAGISSWGAHLRAPAEEQEEAWILSPSKDHERIKSYIGRLIEAYALERGIDLSPYGAWTLRNEPSQRVGAG